MANRAVEHLDKHDLLALFQGACFFASGGGGPSNVASHFLSSFEGSIALIHPSQVPDGARAAVVSAIGSPAAISSGKTTFENAPVVCLERLQTAIGAKVPYVVPFEVGTCGILTPVICAAASGEKFLVDADGNGRAVPEMILSTFAQSNVSISPFCFANDADPKAEPELSCSGVLEYGTIDATSSAIRRLIAAKEFGEIGALAAWSMTGAQVSEVTIAGTVSRALAIGRVILEKGSVDAVLAMLRNEGITAQVLGTGRLQSFASQTNEQGFDMDAAVFDCGDHILSNVAQNENLITWDSRTDRPVAMGPDLVCYLAEPDTGRRTPFRALSNTELADDAPYWRHHDVHIVAVEAPSRIRQHAILNQYLALLANLGYRGPYRPFEQSSR